MKLALVWLAVVNPLPVTVTLAVAVAVDVPGAYCTVMVQLLWAFTTAPDTQVPPVMIENVPPAVPTLLIAGFAFDPDDRSANPRLLFRPEKLRELEIPDALIEAAAKSDPQGFLLFDDLPTQTQPANATTST